MLVFLEGVPGSGKSYDAVASHILPALKARRVVYARLNGLDLPAHRERIAEAVGMAADELDRFLIHLPSADVVATLVAQQNEEQEWELPLSLRNALIIVDECHGFWPAGKPGLLAPIEEFFALHRHYGMDIVVMSQFYKRLHTAIRYRVERKVVYQKLTAVGMEGAFSASYYQTVQPDKYERVDRKTRKYDPAIFPMYKSVAHAGTSTAVYAAGGANVWKKLGPAIAVFGVLLVLGVWSFARFFQQGQPEPDPEPQTQSHQQAKPAPGQSHAGNVSQAVNPAPPPKPAAPPHVQHVLDLGEKARPRLAGYMQIEGRADHGIVQWIDGERVHAQMTFASLRQLGWSVLVAEGVALLSHGDHSVIVSAWPLESRSAVPDAAFLDRRWAGGSAASVASRTPTSPSPAHR